MSAKELRQKSGADLQKELLELRREQFNLRMARATGQAAKPDQFTKVRRSIARLKTVMGEQSRGGVPAAAAVAVQSEAKAPAKAKAAPKAKSVKRKTSSKVKSA
jgi:large subunit ribosomal protein L29